jgi:putative acetyltransferase
MDIAVRPFAPADQEPVRALVLTGLAEHWGVAPDPSFNRDLDDIATSYAQGTTLVAVRPDGTIVGTGTVVPRSHGTAEIVRMAVSTELRGCGIGRQLVDALIDVARSGWEGPAIHTIVLETTSTWRDTIAFYERCGFTITHVADGQFGSDTWFAIAI